ncbi:uncharacterized protein LOC124279245, partial [Haliotis rubra]|uniref:uncharacterized protein LOC124279245 n=1 Tax=Haliotis rubra TaxID=36100 RepID=UPI001EE61217
MAYPDAGTELVEILAKDHFIEALQESEMRLRVQQSRPRTLDEAVQLAVELEAFQHAEIQRQGGRKLARVIEDTRNEDLKSQVSDLTKAVIMSKQCSPIDLDGYYRRFISGFAKVAACLHKLTEKDRAYNWTQECSIAFEHLKSKLISADILAHPDFTKPFILDTDASDFAIGAVLSQ